jgi:hypothetical protein
LQDVEINNKVKKKRPPQNAQKEQKTNAADGTWR